MTQGENLTEMRFGEGVPDYVLDFTYVPLSVYTCIIFSIGAVFLAPGISWYLCPTYRTLTSYQRFDWISRFLSFFHAILVSGLGIYNVLFDKPTWDDTLWGSSYLPRATIAITTGYITCDLGIMLVGFPVSESASYIFHHLAVMLAYVANLLFGPFTYFANIRIIAELSTPFVNLRWILYVLGKKESQLYIYNGFVMLGSFFLVRVALVPFYYYVLLKTLWSSYHRVPVWMWSVCIVASIGLDGINLFWFVKMFRGARKTLRNLRLAKEKSRTRIKGE